jgi:hypothetical protein
MALRFLRDGTFTGSVSAEDNIYLTDAGTVRAKLLLNASDRDNVELRAESLGSTMKFFTVGTEALSLDASQNATFAADGAFAGKLGVGVAAPHGTYDFYNQLTSYFNGAVTVDAVFTQTGLAASTFSGTVTSPTFLGDLSGTINTVTTGTTQTAGDNSTLIATTAYADAAASAVPIGNYLPLTAGSSYPLTGTLYGTSTNFSGNGDYAGSMTLGTGASTAEANLQIGQGRTGNGYSYIDLIGDATYTDYGLRVIRNNAGANTSSAIIHRGTGNLEISSVEASSTLFKTNNTTALTLTNTQNAIFTGNVGIGTTAPSQKLEVNGNIQLTNKANSILFGSAGANGTWGAPKISRIDNSIIISDYSGVQLGGYDGSSYGARVTIKGTGNVGIGTTDPAVKLHVHSTGAAARFYSSTNQVPVSIYSNVTNSTLGFKGLNSTNDYNVRVGATGNDFIAYTSNVERLRILSTGNVGIGSTNPGAKLDVQPAADKKVTKFGSDVTSHYYYDTLEDMVMNFTCTSYYQAEVVITAHQTNGGAYCNQYIRGIWSNNHTSHHWDELENVGHLEGSTIAMTVGQDDATAASGKLTLTFDYSSGSFSGITVRVTDFRNSHAFSIS